MQSATAASKCHQIQLVQKMLTAAPMQCSPPLQLRNTIKSSSYTKYRPRSQWNAVGHSSFKILSNPVPTKNDNCGSNEMQSATAASKWHQMQLLQKYQLLFQWNAVGHSSFKMPSNEATSKYVDCGSNEMQSVVWLQSAIKCSSYKKTSAAASMKHSRLWILSLFSHHSRHTWRPNCCHTTMMKPASHDNGQIWQ